MSLMEELLKTRDYKDQKALLNKMKLLDLMIQPFIVQGMSQYRSFLQNRIKIATTQFNYKDMFYTKIRIVMQILKKEHKQKTLTYVVKKCVFLHMFLHLECETGLINSQDSELITMYTNQLIKVDIPKLSQPEKSTQKLRNSMQKVYNYIRGNSEQKHLERSNSKLKMELTSDKGAIKELTYKVIMPLCAYILKISQEFILYSKILRKKIPRQQEEQIKWKMMNYLGLLSQIITELNRIGKYYKQDLIGCWVLIYYIISTDITIYLNIVAQSVGKLCQHWQQKIILIEKFSKISKNHRGQLKKVLQDQQLSQLVKQVEVFTEYKQKLLYLYFNAQIKPYLSYFQRPEVVTKNSRYSEVFDFILNLGSKANSKMFDKTVEINKDEKYRDSRKTGDLIKKRIHSQHNQMLSPNSTVQTTLRDRIPTDKHFQQKIPIFSTKSIEVLNNPRTNNFISAVKCRAMGK